MNHLIEYMLAVLLVFALSSNSVISWIYCGISSISSLVYCLIYRKRLKKQEVQKEKVKLDWQFLIILVLVVVINAINNFTVVNLIFGSTLGLIIVLYALGFILRKERLSKLTMVLSKYIFDYYVILYLIAMLSKLLTMNF